MVIKATIQSSLFERITPITIAALGRLELCRGIEMIRRNKAKAKRYKKAINQCCNPDCKFGYGLQTHHIVPMSKGGVDNYENYIVLCADCHRRSKRGIHSRYKESELDFTVYKLFIEKLKIGKSSDEDDFAENIGLRTKRYEIGR